MPFLNINVSIQPNEAGDLITRLEIRGEEAEAPFQLETGRDSEFQQCLASVREGSCDRRQVGWVGTRLGISLLPGVLGQKLRECLDQLRPREHVVLRLRLDPSLEDYPWESLHLEPHAHLVLHPRISLVRDLPKGVPAAGQAERPPGPLRVLLVMPEGSGLSTETEFQNLKRSFESLKPAPDIVTLCAEATPDEVLRHLREREEGWDILHFVGHGRIGNGDRIELRFTEDGRERWLDDAVFQGWFTGSNVRLVLLNCCLSAHPDRSFGGLGPILRRRGVPAMVVMRYEVSDQVAVKFARHFYDGLARKEGRIDQAVDNARARLQNENEARAFITPTLYLAENFETLLPIAPLGTAPATGVVAVAPTAPPPAATSLEIPSRLVDALKNRRCIVVAGPGVLRAGQLRSQTGVGPAELAQALVSSEEYPDREAFELSEKAGEWMHSRLLEWVCQYLVQARQQDLGEIVTRLQKLCEERLPSSGLIEQISRWSVPALFYTHFDGALESAATAPRTPPTIILPWLPSDRDHLPPEFDAWDPKSSEQRLFILLRGTLRQRDPGPVLTENENELLLDRVAAMHREIAQLTRLSWGQSVLFLGVDPRDRLVHSLARKLIDPPGPAGETKQGPTYFAWSKPTAADRAYWAQYRTQWLDRDLGDLVQSLSGVLQFPRVTS